MHCDVCNEPVADGQGCCVSSRTFRRLLHAGFGIHPKNIEMLTSSGMSHDEAMGRLQQTYLQSTTDWLLCPKCAHQARNALRQNTKYNRGSGCVDVRDFPPQLARCNGLLPIPAILDPTVGEEVALYWMDRTPFVLELAAIRPFRLMLKSGVYQSVYGPLIWFLFYVPNSKPVPQPFASTELHLNPSETNQVSLWEKLANQTHWHLTLLGAGNSVAEFFEFENHFGLDTSLPRMMQTCQGLAVTDFIQAKAEFSKSYTMDDLYRTS